MDKCKKIGHCFRVISQNGDWQKEKCTDCGQTATFNLKNWTSDLEYGRAHRRDYIQPDDVENWNLAYPNKKVIRDPEKKREIEQNLTEDMLKKRHKTLAETYLRSFNYTPDFLAILKWHMGYEEKKKDWSNSKIFT